MAWERSFEARVMKIRGKELMYQKRNYLIEVRNLWLLYLYNKSSHRPRNLLDDVQCYLEQHTWFVLRVYKIFPLSLTSSPYSVVVSLSSRLSCNNLTGYMIRMTLARGK